MTIPLHSHKPVMYWVFENINTGEVIYLTLPDGFIPDLGDGWEIVSVHAIHPRKDSTDE